MRLSSVAVPALAALLSLLPAPALPARILGAFTHVGKSHFDIFEPLLEALARRGHELTVISHFPRARPLANYTDISLKGTIGFSPTGQIDVKDIQTKDLRGWWMQHRMLSQLAAEGCEVGFAHPEVQQLLKANRTFDLLITELFTTDCFLAFAHHFKIPHISMSSCMLMPWAHARFGNADNPAFIPNLFHDIPSRMTFYQRLFNTVFTGIELLIYEFFYNRPTEAIARHYFPDMPPLRDLAANASLMFVNTHFALNRAKPTVPAVVEIGGIHLTEPKPLPKDLQEYLDGAGPEGVIYFNMGSMIRATTFEPAKRQAFLEAFAQLPARVLWKWEEEAMPGQPKNVKTAKWLPQADILRHPNVRVYIGHGGLLGSIEAADAGVPMLAIPIFGDQRANVQNLLLDGMARRLDYDDISSESVLEALNDLLKNPRYRDRARAVSAAYRDRPVPPLDAAVYWTEYVLRHGGDVLRADAADVPTYQKMLLDVAAALALMAALALSLAVALCRRLSGGRAPAAKLKGE